MMTVVDDVSSDSDDVGRFCRAVEGLVDDAERDAAFHGEVEMFRQWQKGRREEERGVWHVLCDKYGKPRRTPQPTDRERGAALASLGARPKCAPRRLTPLSHGGVTPRLTFSRRNARRRRAASPDSRQDRHPGSDGPGGAGGGAVSGGGDPLVGGGKRTAEQAQMATGALGSGGRGGAAVGSHNMTFIDLTNMNS